MNIKNVYILDDRAILYVNGEDAKEFLQNLISNDINKVSDKIVALHLYYLLKVNFYMSL
jgi:folate-binding Fe-S cluster repair protein YgfZ